MEFFRNKHIPFYFLYDTRGSELYHEITKLEEYYPFKKEEELLNKFADDIVEIKDDLKTSGIHLVEFGAGYSVKTEIIIKKLLKKFSNVTFVPIDVSESACEYSREKYSQIDNLKVQPYVGTYDKDLEEHPSYENRVIYLWLGSSIGNLEHQEQVKFLSKVSQAMSFRDFLLIGFDSSHKDKQIIFRAYNDQKGVTRDFILNILIHLKREFHLELEDQHFEYEGVYNDELERMEMYVTPIIDTRVRSIKGKF